jgi:hypothetical protein
LKVFDITKLKNKILNKKENKTTTNNNNLIQTIQTRWEGVPVFCLGIFVCSQSGDHA